MAGAANAAVLPEPVCDWPTTSLPCISTGMASAWIGAACSKPSLSMAFSSSLESPSSENNFVVMQMDIVQKGQDSAARRKTRGVSAARQKEEGRMQKRHQRRITVVAAPDQRWSSWLQLALPSPSALRSLHSAFSLAWLWSGWRVA